MPTGKNHPGMNLKEAKEEKMVVGQARLWGGMF
jgi:hypothetical protein